MAKPFNIVLLAPSRYSLITICVTELLRRSGANIGGIFVRRLFNPNRFVSEFRRDGTRLLRKIWKKLILRKTAYTRQHHETIKDFMEKEQIDYSHLGEFKQRFDIPVHYCKTLNDTEVVQGLKDTQPDIVVFTGGGLIREATLNASGHGILNCHMGILPRFRGMDVVEWPILENRLNEIGVTVHFMDKGVDTGDILSIHKIPPTANESVAQLRERFEPIMCRQLVRTCLDFLNGNLERKPQAPEEGKQYFMMHPRLLEVAKRSLLSR